MYVKATLHYHGGVVFGKVVKKPILFEGPASLREMLLVKELDEKFLLKSYYLA